MNTSEKRQNDARRPFSFRIIRWGGHLIFCIIRWGGHLIFCIIRWGGHLIFALFGGVVTFLLRFLAIARERTCVHEEDGEGRMGYGTETGLEKE